VIKILYLYQKSNRKRGNKMKNYRKCICCGKEITEKEGKLWEIITVCGDCSKRIIEKEKGGVKP